MDLLVNVTTLTPPLTGIGHYSRNLMDQLLIREEIKRFEGIGLMHTLDRQGIANLVVSSDQSQQPQQASNKDQANPVPANNHMALVKRYLRATARRIPMARTIKAKVDQLAAKRHSKQYRDFVYWEPNYLLLPIEAKAVNTVYDLSHIEHPEYHPAERIKLMEQGLESSIARSEKIIVISEFTRQQVGETFGVKDEDMAIVRPAVSDDFRITPSDDQLKRLRARYKLPEQFVLSVGTLEPRKNLQGLAKAFSRLPEVERRNFPLVLVGCKGWNLSQVEPELAKLESRGELIRLGYVDQADLPLLYSAATAMAYVSFYEGYGMPIAEAMAAGTPVITSNITSMPEVAAGCATLVDPYNNDEITEALFKVLSDPQLRQQQSELGLIKSADYTWESSGDALYDVLASV